MALRLSGRLMAAVGCWLARFSARPCEGRLERAHLIPQQTIRRELRLARPRRKGGRAEQRYAWRVIWDERIWVPACQAHHHALDQSRKLRISRSDLPQTVEDYAEEHGLGWWLARAYGPLRAPA